MTLEPPLPPQDILRHFQLKSPVFVDDTPIARVWQVEHAGQQAALKIYHKPSLSHEGPGFDLLRALDGQGAVRVLAQDGRAVVLEWLDGPSLGDLARAGQDEIARAHLVDVANAVHGFAGTVSGLTPLNDWCADVFSIRFSATCPTTLQTDMRRGQAIARDLLSTTTDIRPLHGDLHHDNIKLGPDGWRAFDAKGLFGDKTFELANAFRNPIGKETLQRDPAWFHACADLWSDRFGVDRLRLMRWAAAKVAISIAWRSGPDLIEDKEADLLAMMLAQLPET